MDMKSLLRMVSFTLSPCGERGTGTATRSLRYTFSDLGAVRDFFLLRPPARCRSPESKAEERRRRGRRVAWIGAGGIGAVGRARSGATDMNGRRRAAATGGWREVGCWRPWTGARKNPKSPRSGSARPTAARSTTTPPCRASHATQNASSSRLRRWTLHAASRARRRARGPDPGDRRAAGFSPTRLHPRATGSSGSVTPARDRVVASDSIADRVHARGHREGRVAPRRRRDGASRRVARGPRWPHRVGHREPRGPIAAEGELGDARVRDDARCAGRRIRDDGVVGKNSPCLLRSTLRAKRYASL